MRFLTFLKNLFGIKAKGDRFLHCQDCGVKFVFDAGEQRFFKTKGFTDPKRCPKCRKTVRPKPNRRSKNNRNHKRNRNRSHRNSLIDGHSPYADE